MSLNAFSSMQKANEFKCTSCLKVYKREKNLLNHINGCKNNTQEPHRGKKENSIIETKSKQNTIHIENIEGLQFLHTLDDNSVDLILTDPPYIISKETGMDNFYNKVQTINKNNIDTKTLDDVKEYESKNNIKLNEEQVKNYLRYGTIYGTKYSVKTNYGTWDSEFTIETLDLFIKEFYKKLVNGGTCIIFFDIWKITILKEILEKYNFK